MFMEERERWEEGGERERVRERGERECRRDQIKHVCVCVKGSIWCMKLTVHVLCKIIHVSKDQNSLME